MIASKLVLLIVVIALSFTCAHQGPTATADRNQSPQTLALNLSADEMTLLIEAMGPSNDLRTRLAASSDERRSLAKNIRYLFAIAEEARSLGYHSRPELSWQIEQARVVVIAKAYERMREKMAKGPEQLVAPGEIEAYFSQPGVAAQFEIFLKNFHGPDKVVSLSDTQRADNRAQYGRIMVEKQKGIAAGLDQQRETQLAILYDEARLLTRALESDVQANFEATGIEIDSYIAAHPELNSELLRTKAEDLLKRARAGDDFAQLAEQFSTEPGAKERRGDLGWFKRGEMVEAFENVAFALKPGEISEVVETPFGFHMIKLEERRTKADSRGRQVEQVRARQIEVGYPREAQGKLVAPRDQASRAVEDQKRTKWMEGVLARHRVVVAEEYTVGQAVTSPRP